MDSRNFTIGVLSTTATILLVGLFVIQSRPAAAVASGMTVSGGPYSMTVGRDDLDHQDYVYVVHAPTGRLIVYRFDPGAQEIEIVLGVDLSTIQRPNVGNATSPTHGYRPRVP